MSAAIVSLTLCLPSFLVRGIKHMHGSEGKYDEFETGPQKVTSVTVVLEANASEEAMAALWNNSSAEGAAAETVSFDGKRHTNNGTVCSSPHLLEL